MEALYLLCSIVSTTSTSIILSTFILIRHLFRLLFKPNAVVIDGGEDGVTFYQGTVWHERRRPVRHSFQYSVRYALFDLENCSQVPHDHLSSEEVRRISMTNGPVFLLTIPPNVGYEQNPLSVYYCYDVEGSTQCLKKCIAEVTNTPWGERVLFLFNPNSDLVAKPLHVSPFMDMHGNWSIRASAPGDDLSLVISVQHPDLENYFTATLTAKRVSSQIVGDQALFFWLMPHKVAFWIYWHAVKLWWKNVTFIQHPRYHNPRYKEIAVQRDGKLWCCSSSGVSEENNQNVNGRIRGVGDSDVRGNNRCFTWRDANWPWC